MVFNNVFDDIDYSDVKYLLGNKVAERQNLEFKQQAWKRNDAGTREMLRDISSMANAYGGYIILGIEANDDGVPIKITDVRNAETERDRIQASCISCVEPRIPGFKIKTIPVPEDESLILIFIPRSTRAPHIVTFKGLNQFWIRHDRQKSLMSIEEIRDVCLRVQNLQKDVQTFIDERKETLSNIVGEEVIYVIGFVPLGVKNTIVNVDDSVLRGLLRMPPDQRKDGFNVEFKDSIISLNLPSPTLQGLKIGRMSWRKAELMRNGYYEFSVNIDNEAHLHRVADDKGDQYAEFYSLPIVEYCVSYFRALKKIKEYIGIEESYISFLVIYNIEKYSFAKLRQHHSLSISREPNYYEKQHLEIEPMEIYQLLNPDNIAKEFLDRIWNAFGFETKDVPYFVNGIFDYEKYKNR